ncbi:DNA replication complex GINS protein PSF1-like [Belonocnema kinseyi]|uniref:DNA replication complex GINS protein PSF1-like n=1 Tax=Belonocnema kinseyi TaxID=2817044 RepID=UPI00143D3C53|nr:DNA replication complex GINS protein PSF1-like [Belonocnema kinseyi]
MYGKEGLKLINELVLSDDIKPFNDHVFRGVLNEIHTLYEANLADAVHASAGASNTHYRSLQFRHAVLNRNKRLLLTYVYHRMKRMRKLRWELGSILPAEIKVNLTNPEERWFNSYNRSLATYMRSIGEEGGLNIMKDMVPPKALYIEVRCLVDYGRFEFDGEIVNLKKNTHHLLPRAECETLIRQGILEHVNI